jgi:plasmid stabilization system protein ParE
VINRWAIATKPIGRGVRRLDISVLAANTLDNLLTWVTTPCGPNVANDYDFLCGTKFPLFQENPFIGRAFDAIGGSLRVLHYRSYRIFYGVDDQRMLTICVLYTAYDAPSILK